MKTLFTRGILSSLFAVLCLIAAPAVAEQIQIELTGLNFKYDGSDIYDSAAKAGGSSITSQADVLSTIDFYKDGSWVGSLTSNIYADLLIDYVKNIPTGGGVITTGDGTAGFGLDLLQSDGTTTKTLLSLSLNELRLSYSGYGIYIAVGGLAESLVSQDLPFGLEISSDDEISFVISSSKLSSLQKNTYYLESFDASGTGDVNGILVPEPTSIIALAGMAAMGLFASLFRRRKTAA
jgi:hypothetical protein